MIRTDSRKRVDGTDKPDGIFDLPGSLVTLIQNLKVSSRSSQSRGVVVCPPSRYQFRARCFDIWICKTPTFDGGTSARGLQNMDLVVERHYKRCEKSPIDAAAVLVGTELT
jgi:hypothetical protein